MRAACLVLLFLPACGSPDGTLSLRLVRAGCEDPFSGVSGYQVRAVDRGGAELGRFSGTAPAELGVLTAAEQRLEIDGLGGEQVVARGRSRYLRPQAGASEELVPFSTLAVAAALPTARALSGALVIDGLLDEWRASPSLVLGGEQRVSGPAQELRAELLLAWGDDALRFALVVADSCAALRVGEAAGTCGVATQPDHVALGFNGSGNHGDSYGAGDLWVEVSATGVTVPRGKLTPAEFPVAMAPLPDGTGWVLEGALRLSALGRGQLAAQDRIGFDIVVRDEDPGQAEPTVLRWSGGTRPASEPTPPARMGTIGFGQL